MTSHNPRLGKWHGDGDECIGIHCGNPEHGWAPPAGSAIWGALDHVKKLVENGPWVSDGDSQYPLDICSYCRHEFSIDESKAHYKGCEWKAARDWLTEAEEWMASDVT